MSFRFVIFVLIIAVFTVRPAFVHAWHFEVGQATTNNTATTNSYTTVSFSQNFDTLPIVVTLATNQGSDPATVRIRNVTVSGFEIAPIEPDGEDGSHTTMTVDYVAIEPGIKTLPGGQTIVAGLTSTSRVQASTVLGLTRSWTTVPFGTTLPASAAVVATLQTMNSETATAPATPSDPFMTVAVSNASTTSARIAIERSEAAGVAVSSEDIGWIAFADNAGGDFTDSDDNTISWQATLSADNIVGWNDSCVTNTFSSTAWINARVIATKNTRDGGDGGWLRRCSLSSTQIGLVIDEDRSNDSERNHTTERAGIIAFSNSFHADFSGEVTAIKSVSLVEDPINGTDNPYVLPGARMRYTITATSVGTAPIDLDTVIISDSIPSNVSLLVSDIGVSGEGPVLFSDGSPPSLLTYNFISLSSTADDVEFSNDNGSTFTYTPVPSGDGTDSNVTDIRIIPSGVFDAASSAGQPNFSVSFDVIVK